MDTYVGARWGECGKRYLHALVLEAFACLRVLCRGCVVLNPRLGSCAMGDLGWMEAVLVQGVQGPRIQQSRSTVNVLAAA